MGRLALVALTVTAMFAGCARLGVDRWPPAPGSSERGWASWYGHPHHGKRTASGEVYDMNGMTAAHRTLPFGTWILVENLDNKRTVEVRINDRGPFTDSRILDLSYAAARALRATGAGLIPIRLRVIGTRPLRRDASD